MSFTATKQTTSAHTKYYPQFQVVNDKIYYVWKESDGSYDQIWTAVSNLDGTGWIATQRTYDGAGANHTKRYPQLQVVGTKIYYVWSETYGSGTPFQIWTAEMNTDGTGWTATYRRKNIPYTMGNLPSVQLQVVGTKIYYVWTEYDGSKYQIWTAEMNTDGTGWTATKRTTSAYNKSYPQLQVVDTKIYYVWAEYNSGYQIWTGKMNIDGSGWAAIQKPDSSSSSVIQFQVVDTKIYYVFIKSSQVWTAEMNIDDTGWVITQRTNNPNFSVSPQLQVVGTKIYYVWFDGYYDEIIEEEMFQIRTAEMNIDGAGWTEVQRDSHSIKWNIEFQVVDKNSYYVWNESDGSYYQIWTAILIMSASRIKHWTGTEWKLGVPKEWDGVNLVEKILKDWAGTEWKG